MEMWWQAENLGIRKVFVKRVAYSCMQDLRDRNETQRDLD